MNDLILVPGLGSDAAIWSRTIAALDDGICCQVGDTSQDDTLAGMAQRILDNAPATFALAGVSMGGMVAFEIMRVASERVTHLAIIDSIGRPDTPEEAAERRRAIEGARAVTEIRAAGEASLAWLVHPDAPARVRTEIVEMGERVGAETYIRQSIAVLERGDQRPILGTSTVPTLVLTGDRDVMVPLERAEEIAAGITGARLVVVPDCGHLPPIEQPETTARLLSELLRGLE